VAWCDGVSTTGLLVSSDCNGTGPARPKITFDVIPKKFVFTVTQFDPNPPDQTLRIVKLSPDFRSYNIATHRNWYEALPPSPSAGLHPIRTTGSNLAVGTYRDTVDVEDVNDPSVIHRIPIILKVKKRKIGSLTGTYHGTWTRSVAGFCDQTADLTWTLRQRGSSVTGSYIEVVTIGCVDPPGHRDTGPLVQGVRTGKRLTILTGGGTRFTGIFDGATLSGTTGSGLGAGTFRLTKQ